MRRNSQHRSGGKIMRAIQLPGSRAGVLVILAFLAQVSAHAADEFGIFELVNQSSASYEETVAAVDAGLNGSTLTVHARHEVRVPEQKAQATVFVITSPAYLEAAAGESPRTISDRS